MEKKIEKERRMKAGVIVRPRKKKEWIIFVLMAASIVPMISPVINVFNVNRLVLGMPVMFLVSLLSLVAVIIVVNIAYKWGVH